MPRYAGTALVAAVLAGAGLLGSACSSPGPAPAPAAAAPGSSPVDPAVRGYCDTVARVQAEQSSPQAGQGGVQVASDVARRQIADLVAAAPPEIAGDWRILQGVTGQALASLAATGGDPARIDRAGLDRLQQDSQPVVDRIKQVTEQRCGITFRPGP